VQAGRGGRLPESWRAPKLLNVILPIGMVCGEQRNKHGKYPLSKGQGTSMKKGKTRTTVRGTVGQLRIGRTISGEGILGEKMGYKNSPIRKKGLDVVVQKDS